MSQYLTAERFNALSLLPNSVIQDIDNVQPEWLTEQIKQISHYINTRMAKRYDVPFSDTAPPPIVEQWIVAIVSVNAWLKRGISATDETFQEYKAKAEQAYTEINEAANSEIGLFELPRTDADGKSVSAIRRGGTLSYSEASPYVGMSVQARRARHEDDHGRGSGS
jgi:hypothetical protein